jgi:3-deoxy-manno-octulosonate cytidylyltransferase (CMP-KDO synthetase)
VWEAADKACLQSLIVATDSPEIGEYCNQNNMRFMMTSTSCATGTDRIKEVFDVFGCDEYHNVGGERRKVTPFDIVLNIQGDEPLIRTYMIDQMIENMIDYDSDVETIGVMMRSAYKEMFKRDVVKVMLDEDGFADVFARRMFPWKQFGKKHFPKQHIGIYAYKTEVFKEFIAAPRTENEIKLDLEQMRLMDNGYKIHVSEFDEYMI